MCDLNTIGKCEIIQHWNSVLSSSTRNIQVKLSLRLIEYNIMKTYRVGEVRLQVFLTLKLY
jgi:hypothetical protein